MFTGIIETTGKVVGITSGNGNLHIAIQSIFLNELKVDQSIAHNGVCLTVTKLNADNYEVTAIEETLQKTNLGKLKVGDWVNLERCMQLNGRLDGHIVQGHVDQIGTCRKVTTLAGSHVFSFDYLPGMHTTVEKGSITVNGVSLTVVNSGRNSFEVAIIPYTFEHTNFKYLKEGDSVNLEFDIIGKYVAKLMSLQQN